MKRLKAAALSWDNKLQALVEENAALKKNLRDKDEKNAALLEENAALLAAARAALLEQIPALSYLFQSDCLRWMP